MGINMWSQLRHKLLCAVNAQLNVHKRAAQAAPAVISSLRAQLARCLAHSPALNGQSSQLTIAGSFLLSR